MLAYHIYFPYGTIHKDEYFTLRNYHFVWDKAKNEANKLNHGIDFFTAAYVFNDKDKLTDDNGWVNGEQRQQTIGEPQELVEEGHVNDTKHTKPRAIIGRVEGIILVVFADYSDNPHLTSAQLERMREYGRKRNEKRRLIMST